MSNNVNERLVRYILGDDGVDSILSPKTCTHPGCEETEGLCPGCGYCQEHHYLSVISKLRNMKQLGEALGRDVDAIGQMIDEAAQNLPDQAEYAALYKASNLMIDAGVGDDAIAQILSVIHELANK